MWGECLRASRVLSTAIKVWEVAIPFPRYQMPGQQTAKPLRRPASSLPSWRWKTLSETIRLTEGRLPKGDAKEVSLWGVRAFSNVGLRNAGKGEEVEKGPWGQVSPGSPCL